MRKPTRKFVKNCHACQINERHKHEYGKFPTKLIITNPWEILQVDLISPYTLKEKDGTVIDFMCLTMIEPHSSWFKLVELPITTEKVIPMNTKGHKGKQTHKQPKLVYFDKSSTMISNLVNKT
jgi:hypothetical protein